MKILMVLTSHSELGNTGKKTGFWLEEFAAPYYVFVDAGVSLTLASPKVGNRPSIHPVMHPTRRPMQPGASSKMRRRKMGLPTQ
jgi:putative intracellular protease/amidase